MRSDLIQLDRKHKHDIKRILKSKEIKLLERLHSHHRNSVVHSFNVATDCVYVAERFHFDKANIERIRVAALLHDIGKIYMDSILLSDGVGMNEFKAMSKFFNRPLDPDPRSTFTMRELIEYRHKLSIFNKKRIRSRKKKSLLAKLGNDADVTILEHIKNHAKWTRALLKSADVDPAVIYIASSHHPEYSEHGPDSFIVEIISIVDKFNAMIQSEGCRDYASALSRSEALELLINKLNANILVVRELGKKYLPIEKAELDSILSKTITQFKKHEVIELSFLETILSKALVFLKINRILHAVDDHNIEDEVHELEPVLQMVH